MKKIEAHYTPPQTKITNERQLVLQDIMEKINAERIDTNYKPITAEKISNNLCRSAVVLF